LNHLTKVLPILTVGALLAAGCHTAAPRRPAGLPLRYQNAQYGFTFFLPASWQGYSVLSQQWEGQHYSPAVDEVVVSEHGPTLILRHPQWKESSPYQDIPILVFTRHQWEADKEGNFSIGAGGTEFEIGHNDEYVFGIHSRFNWVELKGCKDAGHIVEINCAANEPHLHPE
jgi:hypothetical protein